MSGAWDDRGCTSNSADGSILHGNSVLLCKGFKNTSRLVFRDKSLQETLGKLCKRESNDEENKEIHKLLITESGGPFRGRTTEELRNVTVADTLKHPNWVMGRKITVDSATLVNKGLEVMEARWLFDMDLDQVQVVVQPQSIIHSMVEFKDGAIMAQLGTPDMRLPIQYALYYPHRRYLDGDRLDFTKLREITFEVPDMETFRGLPMAIQASREGGSMPTVFNAANELAVKKFLEEKIGFLDIYEIIAQSMERHKKIAHPDLDEILSVEQDTYQWIESRW